MWIKNVYLGEVLKLMLFEKITLNNITTLNKVMCCDGIITLKLLGEKIARVSKRIIRCGRKD